MCVYVYVCAVLRLTSPIAVCRKSRVFGSCTKSHVCVGLGNTHAHTCEFIRNFAAEIWLLAPSLLMLPLLLFKRQVFITFLPVSLRCAYLWYIFIRFYSPPSHRVDAVVVVVVFVRWSLMLALMLFLIFELMLPCAVHAYTCVLFCRKFRRMFK